MLNLIATAKPVKSPPGISLNTKAEITDLVPPEWSKEHSALLPPSIKRASPLEQKRLPESGGPRCEGSLSDCGGRVFSEDWSSNGASDYHGACFNFRNLPASPFATVMKWPSGMKEVEPRAALRVRSSAETPESAETRSLDCIHFRHSRKTPLREGGIAINGLTRTALTDAFIHLARWSRPHSEGRGGWVDNAVLFGKELPLLLDAGESVFVSLMGNS
ncbi:hypothetical protein CEXT_384961 [Caerostris extrusa]|uniref:Uncharacterized protein n=1 Tax=Caerostris extrusa TaxID=172846 RepID=A0AAV4M7P7_CAEEX|nr:hypothetical protein CEXT_384961 [Caerostris extrusa]